MVDLKQLQANLGQVKRPPLERWNPPFCGDIDIRITADGRWLYRGSPIAREALVRLFASVLWLEDGEYYLITPAEKVRIQVDDLPFVVTTWSRDADGLITVTTNTGECYPLNDEFPLCFDQQQPAVKIRDGFLARVHRNVYYQWAEHATPAQSDEADGYYLQSANSRFYLGSAS